MAGYRISQLYASSTDSSPWASQMSLNSLSSLQSTQSLSSHHTNSSMADPSSPLVDAARLNAGAHRQVGQMHSNAMLQGAKLNLAGHLGGSAINFAGGLIQGGLGYHYQTKLLERQFEYTKKLMTHQTKESLARLKGQHAINRTFYDDAGIPFLPGGSSSGDSSIQFVGNNYQHVRMPTADTPWRGTRAQIMHGFGNKLLAV